MSADKKPVIGSAHGWQPPRYHRRLTDAFGPYAELHVEQPLRERIAGWVKIVVPALLIVLPIAAYVFCTYA